MLPLFGFKRSGTRKGSGQSRTFPSLLEAGLMVGICWGQVCGAEAANGSVGEAEGGKSSFVVTNAAQFRSVPREVFLGRCAFRLSGLVTLVDSNRNLLVVQDETGAVALNSRNVQALGVQIGHRISLTGSRCVPYAVGFPDFPYRPDGWGVRPTLETPANWGSYYLSRLRGYLRPPATGEYTFWIASDNSSELWLSSDNEPTKVKKIAFLSRYSWVAPHEWAHYPAQRSENIFLQANQSYYLEVLHEQTSGADHLAVAWQGPSVKQAVIAERHLTPWLEHRDEVSLAATNGVRHEYWTNFSLGDLATLTGPRPFESVLSVDELRVIKHAASAWPKPQFIELNQPLQPEDNYVWAEVQGKVTFAGREGETGFLELSDGETQIQVRVLRGDPAALRRFHNATVHVTGVCEGVYDREGVLAPGLIWVAQADGISLMETEANPATSAAGQSARLVLTDSNPAMVGFYGTRGVVTFNDRVFGSDYMFVQEETAAIAVSLKGRNFENQFEVGRWVELGGSFRAGKNIPVLSPLVARDLGWRAMPAPMTQAVTFPVPGSRDGRWTEIAGVVHTVTSNGTLTLMGNGGPLSLWIGKTTATTLSPYVDAKLRARGVLSLTLQDAPLLLVPSASFVEVEREAPSDPFAGPARLVSDLFINDAETAMSHRVKVAGRVTFHGARSFFLQDASGGIRVQPAEERAMPVGQELEVVGFRSGNGAVRLLTEALVRSVGGVREVPPQKLNAGEGISLSHAGMLIQINANLLAQRNEDGRQVLELQEQQRVLTAVLPLGNAALPALAPGSRLQLSGVCDFATVAPANSGNVAAEGFATGAPEIWLRSPADVVLLSGPPWWTWKHTAALVGALFTVLGVSLLRLQLLRHRLERQLAFSRQILESQESERHRIAANLHDSLGQNLLVIKNQARLAMQPAADESVLRQRLDQISGCASQAIDDVRDITHALRPYQLDRLGLTQTIRSTVNRAAEHSSILFASHADDIDGLFDKESEIHVYRIVQEAVNNILKHSSATEAAVVVKRLTGTVSMSIRDNGHGFEPATLHEANSHDVGYGLSGIKERVRILGGTFAIDARAGQGTALSIEIPVPVPKHEGT